MEKGPQGGIEIYSQRRKKLLSQIQGGVAIIPSAQEVVRNNDVFYPFRQDSSFYYLTGFTEPESIIVLDPASPNPFILFVRERDPARELWDGFRYGVEGAQQFFGSNKVYPIKEFPKLLPDLLKNAEQVFYKIGENKETDTLLFESLEIARRLKGRTGTGVPSLVDIKQVIGEMRLYKSREEIELLRKAAEISAHGHIAGMRLCGPGMHEYEIQAEVEKEFRKRGSERVGYGSIVGGGANATVLHYVNNTDALKDGDFLLVDAGAEYGYVTGDITRTFPVNGRFTATQKKFYEAVLKTQKDCVAYIKPGIRLVDIHARAIDGLIEGMLELGLLKGSKKELIERKTFLKYFPHGTSHWLGMDVHDAGLYSPNGVPRKLETSMCFTVEPGLYVSPSDKEAPQEYRGLGVRIEDDVIVTGQGCEVLTKLAPKEISEIESIVGKSG